MIEITHDDDQHVFKVQVKRKGSVCADAFELSAALVQSNAGDQPKVEDLVSAMRQVAYMEEDESDLANITDLELAAVAAKILGRMEQLGNVSGPQLSMRPSTGPSPSSAA